MPSPPPSFLPGLDFTSRFSASSPQQRSGTGKGGCGQFITRCLCCFFLPRGGLYLLTQTNLQEYTLVDNLAFPGAFWIHRVGCCLLPQIVPPQELDKWRGVNANRIWIQFLCTCSKFCEIVYSFLMVNLGLVYKTNP